MPAIIKPIINEKVSKNMNFEFQIVADENMNPITKE